MRNRFVSGLAVLEEDLAHERAAALGRLGRRLEESLANLRAHDDALPQQPAESDRNVRRDLVLAAGEALWYFIVQRELTGLRDSAHVMRDYRVPKEVQACMGLRPPGR